jgi:hypothetical protein
MQVKENTYDLNYSMLPKMEAAKPRLFCCAHVAVSLGDPGFPKEKHMI